jgi:hypothetical protein
MTCWRLRRSSGGGRGRDRRAAARGPRSRGQLLRTDRVQRREGRRLRARRARRARRDRHTRRGWQWRTPGLRGGGGRGRPCGVDGREWHCGGTGRGRIRGAGRLLHESLRAVASADSRRNREQTGEHEYREHRCHHDSCPHDTRTHNECLAHRVASLAVTRSAALRRCAPEALGVPRRTVLLPRHRERFGSRQEIVFATSHDSHPPSPRPITCPPPYTAVRPAEGTRQPSAPVAAEQPGNTPAVGRTRQLTRNPKVANAMATSFLATRSPLTGIHSSRPSWLNPRTRCACASLACSP